MIEKRLTRNGHGDPVLTIRVTGSTDVERLTWVLSRSQVDFSRLAARIKRSHRRIFGRPMRHV